jgi:hypothetical protein
MREKSAQEEEPREGKYETDDPLEEMMNVFLI